MPRIFRLSGDARNHTDKDPHLTVDTGGRLWVAWQSYRMKEDRILARFVHRNRRGPVVEVSDTPGINFQPRVAPDVEGGVRVVWSAVRQDRWRILVRKVDTEGCGSLVELAEAAEAQVFPAITSDDEGRVWVAWSSMSDGTRRILGRVLVGGVWSDTLTVSSGPGEHLRPVLCKGPSGSAWLAYETHSGGMYDIHLRRWSTTGLSRPVRVSLTDAWEMHPRLCSDGKNGVWATWVATHDVTNNKGFIDHKVEAMAAHFDGKRLSPYRSPDGNRPDGYVAHLYDGLLGRNWYMGFVGWRRRPQIVRDPEGDVWVLYERKEDERVNRHGPDALFYARPLTGPGRQRSYVVDTSCHAYTVSGDLPVGDGRLWFAGQVPEGRHYADICAGTLALDRTRPAKERPPSRWRHWTPVRLPEKPALPQRPVLKVGEKTYRLYWGDPHCHGNLSGDAEGEIDENYAYGRYKSLLDFMAVTDNDIIYDNMLTPSEWALIRAEARYHDAPGRFVALSAYERTYRQAEARRLDVKTPTRGGPRGGLNHRIALFPKDEGPLYRSTEPDADTPEKWAKLMSGVDAFIFPHHETWSVLPNEPFDGAELCSCWDNYIQAVDTIPAHLCQGHRFAFMGNSDSHRIVPGSGGALTGVWAEELTREGIFEALRARRCFATNGERIALDVRINGAVMGAEVESGPDVPVECVVEAPRPVTGLSLFRDGVCVLRSKCAGKKVRKTLKDRPGPGRHVYYLEVQLEPLPRKAMGARCGNLQVARGDLAWSSPIWVKVMNSTS